MALKNSNISKADPKKKVNAAFINAVFQEATGRPATKNELEKFSNYSVKDVG